ncbi:hypothetical protein KUTeg_007470 [Tegillarca granosa]|uniref:RNA-dependent RNA polymerase n=1 Tax=Tegillarca granosa TaxID=220873 RepID=A0ABQ9FDD0_TEGGR|nr:hypothetical protein KUTeg_007470 [Tegillarca granosa]
MGTVDETGTLNYGEVFISYSNESESSKAKTIVHKGTVIVAKNPCFHPGDLRKFEAIDIPCLYHMVDCIVFPQNGNRPHPDEMSGSDLDGDMYFVCWDQSFIPPNENKTPMDFPKSEKKKTQREITLDDIVDFLGDYIKNDRLGVIANAHVVHADMESIFSDACLELAKLHSDAVDFPKTGKIPEISRDLIVEKYPDFMMKKDKAVYNSEKILGKLFRECDFITTSINRFRNCELIENAKENPEFLQNGYQNFLESAQIAFNIYSQKISNLMNQYGIKTEAELFTGMLLSMKSQRGCLENERFELAELIQTKLSKICRDTRIEFFKEFGGEENAKNNVEFVQAKASAWYSISYGFRSKSQRFLSFPWLLAEFVVSKSRHDESKHFTYSCFTEIGSTVEKHVNQNTSKRMDLFHDMMRHIKYVDRANIPLVGVLPVCLLSDRLTTITFYTNCSQKEAIDKIPQYRFKTKNVSDPDMLQKTIFVRCVLEKNPKTFFSLSYVLDWARDRKLVNTSLEDELEFIYILANILNIDGSPVQDMCNLSALNLKWIKNVRLSMEDVYALGKETIRLFKEYLKSTVKSSDNDSNIPKITKEVLNAVLDLSLYSSLESLDNEIYEEKYFPLPYDISHHFYSAKEYVALKLQERTNVPYVTIGMSQDNLLILYAWGPYGILKHIQQLLDLKVWNNNLLIHTSDRNMVLIKNSVIFAFEGCSGKDDMLEYTRYDGECNPKHKSCNLATPSHQRKTGLVKAVDCHLFTEACLKQIESANTMYDKSFHGDLSMSIVLGRLYLVNAPKEPTSIRTFEEKISELTEENEKNMKSGKVYGYREKKIQQIQKHFLTKSFKPMSYDVEEAVFILCQNGFEIKYKETSYNLRLNLERTFSKYRKCIVLLDEKLAIRNVKLAGLDWIVADVIREKSQSKSLADLRFKLSSYCNLDKEKIKNVSGLYGLPENGKYMMQKSSESSIEIHADFVNRITSIQENTVYSISAPGQDKFDILISSFVEYKKVGRFERIFRNVEKHSEVSIIPFLPDISNQKDWSSLLRSLWEFSFCLSNVLDKV